MMIEAEVPIPSPHQAGGTIPVTFSTLSIVFAQTDRLDVGLISFMKASFETAFAKAQDMRVISDRQGTGEVSLVLDRRGLTVKMVVPGRTESPWGSNVQTREFQVDFTRCGGQGNDVSVPRPYILFSRAAQAHGLMLGKSAEIPLVMDAVPGFWAGLSPR